MDGSMSQQANQPNSPVIQLRVALTALDYERLRQVYTVGLGLEPVQVWTHGEYEGLMLEMGRGTLEIFDEGYAAPGTVPAGLSSHAPGSGSAT